MDPALPLFTLENVEKRLDTTDAKYVQIIHTNGGRLAFSDPLGHADFYPNGGRNQTGCGLDIFGICAHGRSYKYLAESMLTGRFLGRECNSYEDFIAGVCSMNRIAHMGEIDVDTKAIGTFYLHTRGEPPFALGEP